MLGVPMRPHAFPLQSIKKLWYKRRKETVTKKNCRLTRASFECFPCFWCSVISLRSFWRQHKNTHQHMSILVASSALGNDDSPWTLTGRFDALSRYTASIAHAKPPSDWNGEMAKNETIYTTAGTKTQNIHRTNLSLKVQCEGFSGISQWGESSVCPF